jgi:2-polyprenyl-3-methyl-5-hydroxy-6-metoxy-1,4-benzoquinol methylase
MLEANELSAATARYWDAVAAKYLELFRDEFQGKAYDRQTLATFAAGLSNGAKVCDAGCGPCGPVARMLANSGLDVTGIDLSRQCVELARLEQPGIQFEQMDIGAMSFPNGSFHGLVAYYSLHYQPKARLGAIVREFARVLAPDGLLLIVAKEGATEGWIEDPIGTGQQIFWCDFSPSELESLVRANGFGRVEYDVRDPLPGEIAAR